MKLSVLDQSPVHDGGPPARAPADTLALAETCDALGYHRYWVAEHHDTAGYAGSCPEILIGHIAARTRRLRVGSGGVMLSHYSPFKVAEVFSMLATLHPGRIDLGLGRAPGGDQRAAAALAWPGQPAGAALYGRQVSELRDFLHDTLPEGHPLSGLQAVPAPAEPPGLWLLGSGDGSAAFAGSVGAGFALALFIGTHDRPRAIVDAYRDAFVPTPWRVSPEALLAVAVICADNREEAEYIAATHTYWKVQAFRHGVRIPLLPPAECLDLKKRLSPSDQAYYDETLATMVLGSPEECRAELAALAEAYGVDEIMAVNVCHHFADRRRSYELLAGAGLAAGQRLAAAGR